MSETDVTSDQEAEYQEESAAAEANAETHIADLQTKLAEAQAKAEESWDQVLRSKAETDNLRRRHERELENAHKFALERFTQELLPVKDSLEMGLVAAEAEEAQIEKLREGTELTLKMFETVMDKFGIKEVHPLDEPFNPDLHQAMSLLEAPDKAPNTVIDVMQKGYTLNDRLIRPAMVVVSKAPAAKSASEKKTQDEGTSGTNIDDKT